jgi:hypothetical protein
MIQFAKSARMASTYTQRIISKGSGVSDNAHLIGKGKIIFSVGQIIMWISLGIVIQVCATGMFVLVTGQKTQLKRPSSVNIGAQRAFETNPVPAERAPQAMEKTEQMNASLFAEPQRGEIYLQMKAISKGMAVILVESLRSHGLAAFVAPGSNANIRRVLVGPLKGEDELSKAKKEMTSLELSFVARRFYTKQ